MGRRRPVRQLGDQRTVIETVPHVRQIELADAKFTGPGEDSVEVRVGRMRLAREAVGDPHVHAFVQRGHFVAHLAEIDGISDRASAFVEAHAHRGRTAVRLIDETDLRLAEGPVRAELVPFQDGPIEIGSGKGISEALFQARKGLAVGMQRHCVAQRRGDRPQVVETVAMIAMIVGDNHRVDPAQVGSEQLLTKVGAAIDQHPLPSAFDQDRRAQARVARLVRVALAPFITDLRDPGRRPATEDPDFHAGLCALPNSLKKFAVVASASFSGSSPLRRATNAAVSATNAGSHFWPRCGTGARNGESVSTSIWSAGSHLAVSWRSWAFLNVTIPLSDT